MGPGSAFLIFLECKSVIPVACEAMCSVSGRGAAFFTLLRRAGTHGDAECTMGPGSAAHHAAKCGALRSIRGTLALEPGRSPRCHNPRRGIWPDPVRSIVCRKCGSHCR